MNRDVHTLSGAYALDALTADEAEEFRRHLADCPACCEEVRELRETAARMAAAEAVVPPAALKTRILTAADRTPQVPPRTVEPAAVAGPRRTASRRWVTWMAAAAAAGIVLAGGVIGIRALVEPNQPQLSAAAAKVFDASDVETRTVRTDNGGKLVVGLSPSQGEMAVDSRDLPHLDGQHVYQLWAVTGSSMASAGLLSDPDTGAAMAAPPRGTEVAMTIEPAGGSSQPTTQPIVIVDPASL